MAQPFKRALGLFDAIMIVIGGIIGAGIFINPYIVAQRLDSSGLVIGAWLAGAAIALIGALAYAELGAMLPAPAGSTSTCATPTTRWSRSSMAGRCCS